MIVLFSNSRICIPLIRQEPRFELREIVDCTSMRIEVLADDKQDLVQIDWTEVNFKVQEWVISNPAVTFGSMSARNLRRPICVYPWTGCEWR
ncbi:hypothetical protein FGIG_11282 [Fasciola gigantica]|uniref:Uncharacterized protein n=1 Tax=Fasciola gigantica TaxID=46835 RepID=A0A504YQE9_FASGI|nr:hypothetical protein FGIG_11282 [Fasciola gigantica]